MKNYKNIASILILIFFSAHLFAEGDRKDKSNNLNKTNGQPEYTRFNINNISTWLKNDGEADINKNGNSGFIFPKGTYKGAIYQSGFVYGGKVDDEIRVSGSTWHQGQVPGKILLSGIREDRNLPHVRIYRVRRDYKTADLSMEAQDEGITIQEVYKQYEKDWHEWRAEDGAPYEDINNDGIYDPSIDIPGMTGADQTIWFVANDLDTIVCENLYGSLPLGIEMQVTTWGYNKPGFLTNIMFKNYILINKSEKNITDMYFGEWSDPDVGDATDDLGGCDTTLDLGYSYNGNPIDATYGAQPPAVGFQILNDFEKPKYQHKMTSFNMFYKTTALNGNPTLGHYERGTLEMYDAMNGLYTSGQAKVSPNGDTTKFNMSGDPINKTGWYDGVERPPGDRSFLITAGPFELAKNDTQKITFAQIAAIGSDNLDSVQKLKFLASYLKSYWTQVYFIKDKPFLESVPFDKSLLLKWSFFDANKNNLEQFAINNVIHFEGYNIYQLPRIDSPKEEYVHVKTFDKVNGVREVYEDLGVFIGETEFINLKFYGTDSGLERYFEIEKDYINNTPLRNGTPYYFVVSSYLVGKNYFRNQFNYETFSEPIKVIPHSPNPGIRYESEIGDSIYALHARGSAQAEVNIIVVDPTEVTGNEYEIRFRRDSENKIVWDLENITTNETVLQNQTNISGSDDYVIVDGIRIIITEEAQKMTDEDLYRFTTPKVIYDEELAKADVEKINVFPNPYYGYNPMETQKLGNFVMINHLPEKAVIRVFNLAGQLVRTLRKENTEQFYLWDLQNEHQLLVASGLYILHIEMPELGKVKVLKLAVILGTEVPDFY